MMLFPSSRPHPLPTSTTDSQYDTATGFSSSSYARWPEPPAKSNFSTTRHGRSTSNTSSRRRFNYQNVPYSDISYDQYSRQQSPIYSTISPRRAIFNNLSP